MSTEWCLRLFVVTVLSLHAGVVHGQSRAPAATSIASNEASLDTARHVLEECRAAIANEYFKRGVFKRFLESKMALGMLERKGVADAAELARAFAELEPRLRRAHTEAEVLLPTPTHIQIGGPQADVDLSPAAVEKRVKAVIADSESAVRQRRVSAQQLTALQAVILLKKDPKLITLRGQLQHVRSLAQQLAKNGDATVPLHAAENSARKTLEEVAKVKDQANIDRAKSKVATAQALLRSEIALSGHGKELLGKLNFEASRLDALGGSPAAQMTHQFMRPNGKLDAAAMMQAQFGRASPDNLPQHLRNNPILRAQMEGMAQQSQLLQHKDALAKVKRLKKEAAVHAAAGRHTEAIARYKDAADTMSAALGAEHDQALAARLDVARAEQAAGHTNQALTLVDATLVPLEGKSAAAKTGLLASTLQDAHLLRCDLTYELHDFEASATSLAVAKRYYEAGPMAALQKQTGGYAGLADAASMFGDDAFERRADRLLPKEQRLAKLAAASQLRTAQLMQLALATANGGDPVKTSAAVRRAAVATTRDTDHIANAGMFLGTLTGAVTMHALQESLALMLAKQSQRPEDALLAYWLSAGRKDRVFSVDSESASNTLPGLEKKLAEALSARTLYASRFLEALEPNGRLGASLEKERKEVGELESRLFHANDFKAMVLATRAPMFAKHDVASLTTTADRELFDGVRNALASDQVLVEFVRYAPLDLEDVDLSQQIIPVAKAKGPERFIAFVITKTMTHPQLVDLGEADAIAGKVAALRDLAGSPNTALDEVEAAAHQLHSSLWIPLTASVPTGARLLLSVDAELHSVPFEALSDGSQWLLNQHQISYVNNGLELTRAATQSPAARQLPGAVLASPQRPEKRYRHPALQPGKFDPLEATQAEADAVSKHFPSAQIFLGDQANEPRLLAIRSPRFLHIATHGVFLAASGPANEMATRGSHFEPRVPATRPTSNQAAASAPTSKEFAVNGPPEDHWLRSALVLSPSPNGAPFDSFTTAYEVARMDLRGTRMVVLAACDTALGVTNRVEGARSLERAFMMAGADSVVASLWPAEDRSTRDTMDRFYGALAAGSTKAHALREAKLTQQKATPHPFFWAPFTLTGKDSPL